MIFPSSTGYYKVLAADLLPFHGGRGAWQVGVERSVEGELMPCVNGLHAVTLGQLPWWLGPSIHPVLAVSAAEAAKAARAARAAAEAVTEWAPKAAAAERAWQAERLRLYLSGELPK